MNNLTRLGKGIVIPWKPRDLSWTIATQSFASTIEQVLILWETPTINTPLSFLRTSPQLPLFFYKPTTLSTLILLKTKRKGY